MRGRNVKNAEKWDERGVICSLLVLLDPHANSHGKWDLMEARYGPGR